MDDRELKELKRKVDENNRILKSLQSRARWSTVGTLVKWIIYIIIAFVLWYYIQPFIEKALDTIDTVQGVKTEIESGSMSGFIELFKNKSR